MALIRKWDMWRETVVGLDMAESVITAAQARKRRNGRIELERVGMVEIPDNASAARIAATIRSLWRSGRFDSRTVRSCFRDRSLVLKHFHYPAMPQAEVDEALALEAEATLQLERGRISMDRLTYQAPTADAPREITGILAAAPRDAVDRHLALLSLAGLYPVVLEVACMSVCHLFTLLKPAARDGRAVCLADLTRTAAAVSIVFEGHCTHPRTVFSRSGAWPEAVAYLAESVTEALKYHQFKRRRAPVEQLVLTGQVPGDPQFVSRLREATGLPVWIWDPLPDFDVRCRHTVRTIEAQPSAGPLFATSLGLALRQD